MKPPPTLHSMSTCTAILWHAHKPCPQPAAPGATFCAAHQSLLAPLDATTGPYTLDPQILPAAARTSLAEEIALVRLCIKNLVDDGGPTDVLVQLMHLLTSMVVVQRRLERLALRRGK